MGAQQTCKPRILIRWKGYLTASPTAGRIILNRPEVGLKYRSKQKKRIFNNLISFRADKFSEYDTSIAVHRLNQIWQIQIKETKSFPKLKAVTKYTRTAKRSTEYYLYFPLYIARLKLVQQREYCSSLLHKSAPQLTQEKKLYRVKAMQSIYPSKAKRKWRLPSHSLRDS